MDQGNTGKGKGKNMIEVERIGAARKERLKRIKNPIRR